MVESTQRRRQLPHWSRIHNLYYIIRNTTLAKNTQCVPYVCYTTNCPHTAQVLYLNNRVWTGLMKLNYSNNSTSSKHTSYLSFFLHKQNFWRIKFTPKKTRKLRQNTQKIANFLRYYGKIHSKLPIFCVKSVKIYTGQKNLHENSRGSRDKYQVCVSLFLGCNASTEL